MKQIAVIGNGKMAVDCLRILLARPEARLSLVVCDPRRLSPTAGVSSFCRKKGIRCLASRDPNRTEVVDRIAALEPDILFSIDNQRILKPALLSIPRFGAINFHNGPLPRFGGVNIPSWAILQGVARHGVTWHFVDEGIDTGDIIAQRWFDVSETETAISLTFKCIVEGVLLFSEIAGDVLAGRCARTPQSGESSYFSLRDVPNGGYVDFTWTFAEFDRFVRALDFRPFENTFTFAKTKWHEADFIVNRVSLRRREAHPPAPGTVVRIGHESLEAAVADAILGIDEVMDENGEEIRPSELATRCGIRVSDVLGR